MGEATPWNCLNGAEVPPKKGNFFFSLLRSLTSFSMEVTRNGYLFCLMKEYKLWGVGPRLGRSLLAWNFDKYISTMGNSLENFLPKSSAVGVKILFRTQFIVAIRFTNFTHLISPEKLVVNFIVEVLVNLVSELITVLCPHLIGDEEPLKVNFFKNWSILTRSSGISAFQVEMKPNRKKKDSFYLAYSWS